MTEFFDLIYSCRQDFSSIEELDEIYRKSQDAGSKIDKSEKDRLDFVTRLITSSNVLTVNNLIDMTDYLSAEYIWWEDDRHQKRMTCLGVN